MPLRRQSPIDPRDLRRLRAQSERINRPTQNLIKAIKAGRLTGFRFGTGKTSAFYLSDAEVDRWVDEDCRFRPQPVEPVKPAPVKKSTKPARRKGRA